MISILHPTRGRPQKSFETIDKWLFLSSYKNFELIISVDDNDTELMNYHLAYYLLRFPYKIIENSNRSAVDAINNAAKAATGNVLMVASDDTECPVDWDLFIENQTYDKTDWILKTQDGIQPWMITMPVMDRAYYNRFGYIYHPDYLHMFCDTELTCVADITGRKITSNLLFPHKHYSVTHEHRDELHKRNDDTWAQGEKLFLERSKRNFDLPPGKPIEDNGMMNWLKRKLR